MAWPHVIKQLRDVGLSELRACESLLRRALLHLLKLHAWPYGPTARWRAETIGFLADAQARFTPAMRQRVSLDALYRKAAQQVRAAKPDNPSRRDLPAICPLALDDLLADDSDLPGRVAKLGQRPGRTPA